MRIAVSLALLLGALPLAAQSRLQTPAAARAAFDHAVQRHIDGRARSSPEWATSLGLHTADRKLDDRSAAAERADSIALAGELRDLNRIDTVALDERRRVDWLLLHSVLETAVMDAGMRHWQRRPGAYVPFGAIYSLTTATEPSERERMTSIVARLRQWPAAIALGRKQIVASRTPQLWVDLDISSARGIESYLRDELPRIVAKGGGDTVALARARGPALAALEAYTAWMRDTLRPVASGDWKLGEARYDWRLRHSKLLDTDAASLIAMGHRVFAETERDLAALAREIDPNRTWRQLADSSKSVHPAADSVFAAYSREAARARQFIADHHLFTMPAGERLDMVLTPPNLRSTYAYGGYNGAPPFEKQQVGHFFVTPVEPGWTPAQVESKLRGHNYGWITMVAVHEGYPGHHLQFVRAARQPSVIRKVYGSEVYTEGWGLYSEELMYQSGFFPGPLARLTQLRMRLWRAARVIIDPSIHTGRMSFDEAVRFFVDSVGLETADATAEVNRYTTWPTQAISYIVGMQAIEDLRDEAKRTLGSRFDLTRFHDAVLEQGSLPPVLMRRAVLARLQ